MLEIIKKILKRIDFIEKEVNPVAIRLYIAGYSGNFNDIKEAKEFEGNKKQKPVF